MQTVAPIEFIILERINDVEPDQPTNDRASENDCEQDFERADRGSSHRQPGANRRQGKCKAQKKMGEISEPLGEGIKADDKKRDGREIKTKPVNEKTRGDQPGSAEAPKQPGAR